MLARCGKPSLHARPGSGRSSATAATLTLARLSACLLLAHTGATTGQARAAAVLAWLAACALIARMLRTQPALPCRADPAFPSWALAAIAAGITATLTPAGQLIGLQALPLHWLPAITGLVVIATAAAYAASRTPARPAALDHRPHRPQQQAPYTRTAIPLRPTGSAHAAYLRRERERG